MFAAVLLACSVIVPQDSHPARRVLRGKVLDPKGLPVAGAEILAMGASMSITMKENRTGERWTADSPPAAVARDDKALRKLANGDMALALGRSAEDGSFALPCPPGRCRLLTAGSTVTLFSTPVDEAEHDSRDLLLVTSESMGLTGTVRDEQGQTLDGVSVEYDGVGRGLYGFPLAMDAVIPVPVFVMMEVGADGVLRLTGVPLHLGSGLLFEKKGFENLWLPITRKTPSPFSVTMRRADPDEDLLAGIVVDTEGVPVAGAEVRMQHLSTRTDGEGRFRLKVTGQPPAMALSARKKGVGLAWIAKAQEVLSQPDGRSKARSLVLRLLPMRGRIAGRVVTAEGVPVAGVNVFVEGATWLDSNECVEGVAGCLKACDGRGVVTDADGRFELTDLQDKGYHLRTLDPHTGLSVRTSRPVPNGIENYEFVIPKDAVHERLAVEVRDRDGNPVAGANIVVVCESPFRSGMTSAMTIDLGKTDRDGRLELRDVPRRDANLEARSDTHLSLRYRLEGRENPAAALRLVLERKCRVRLELTGVRAEQSRAASFLDANGALLKIHVELSKGHTGTQERCDLSEGQSGLLTVSERASTLVLQKDEGEERVPIRLDPKEITVIR